MTPTISHDRAGNANYRLALAACPSQSCAEDGDGDSASLDNALRLAWLWLGGVFLPCAGIVLYALGLQASP